MCLSVEMKNVAGYRAAIKCFYGFLNHVGQENVSPFHQSHYDVTKNVFESVVCSVTSWSSAITGYDFSTDSFHLTTHVGFTLTLLSARGESIILCISQQAMTRCMVLMAQF